MYRTTERIVTAACPNWWLDHDYISACDEAVHSIHLDTHCIRSSTRGLRKADALVRLTAARRAALDRSHHGVSEQQAHQVATLLTTLARLNPFLLLADLEQRNSYARGLTGDRPGLMCCRRIVRPYIFRPLQ